MASGVMTGSAATWALALVGCLFLAAMGWRQGRFGDDMFRWGAAGAAFISLVLILPPQQ